MTLDELEHSFVNLAEPRRQRISRARVRMTPHSTSTGVAAATAAHDAVSRVGRARIDAENEHVLVAVA